MELLKYVRERDYELSIGRGFAIYVDCDSEVRIDYTDDGVYLSGEDTSFERLYLLLRDMPELRVVNDARPLYLDTERLDEYTSEEDAMSVVKIAQIADWLGPA